MPEAFAIREREEATRPGEPTVLHGVANGGESLLMFVPFGHHLGQSQKIVPESGDQYVCLYMTYAK